MDAGTVFSVLEAACYAQQSTAQQAAMKSLQDFESVDGFATSLIQIIDSEQVPDSKSDCRLLAVITLKNVVSRCWKSRGSTVHLLNSHEKSYLKEFTLKRAICKEKDTRVLTQLSVLMSQVAKVEWPADWPQLLPSLFDDLKSGELEPTFSSSSKNDAMKLFYSVILELASKTTPNAKNDFKSSALFMFPYFAKTLEGLSLNLIALLPECCNWDKNIQSDSLSKANILAEQLSIVTNILDIFVSKVFTSISNTPDFASFFIFLLDQQTKYLCYLQGQSQETIERFSACSDRYSLTLVDSTGNDGWDIDKILGNIHKNGGDNGDASVMILLLRVSNITNKISSIPVILQKEHPLEMVPYLESFLELFHKELTDTYQPTHGTSSRTGILMKNILSLTRLSSISAILFISNTISCKVYSTKTNSVAKLKEKLNFQFKLPTGSPGNIDAQSSQVENVIEQSACTACNIKIAFFQPGRVSQILQLLLTKCLLLSTSELTEWSQDAEIFYIAQEGLTESDTVKTAAEGLYLGLLDIQPAIVGGTLSGHLNNLPRQVAAIESSSQSIESDIEIGFWNSVYMCGGLGPAVLGEYMDISDWVSRAAGPLVSQLLSHPRAGSHSPFDGQTCGPQVMRARLLWLLGIISYQLNPVVLAQIVPVLLSVLESPDSDLVVVMTTVSSLGLILQVDGFLRSKVLTPPDIVRTVSVLCLLTTKRLEEEDTKERVITVIRDLLGSLGMSFFSDMEVFSALTYHLTALWGSSDPTSRLRLAIIETLGNVVHLSGPLSPALHATCLPLVEYATSGAQESAFLVQDALVLWQEVLHNLPLRTPTGPPALLYTAELNELLKKSLLTLFSCGLLSDNEGALEDIMIVIEAYAISGGLLCLSSCFESLQVAFSRVLGQTAPRLVPVVTKPLEAFALANPQETALFLLRSGLFSTILLPCCAMAPEINQTKILESFEEADIAVLSYLSIFARTILSVPNVLTDVLEAVISSSDLSKIFCITIESSVIDKTKAQQSLFSMLVRLMIDKFDSVAYCTTGAWRRKLWYVGRDFRPRFHHAALALLSLYPQADPLILGWFPEVVNIAQDVLCEEEHSLVEDAEDSSPSSRRDLDEPGDSKQSKTFAAVYDALRIADIVSSSSLRNITGAKIQAVKEVVGEVAFNQGMMATLGRTF